MKTTSKFKGVVFAKEQGIAFINLQRGMQVWLPSKGLKVGGTAYVTVKVAEAPKRRKTRRARDIQPMNAGIGMSGIQMGN